MINQLNYPIKYAILEVKEKGGWAENYKDITEGFIASKCYIIESDIVYDSLGNAKLIHKVVFPFDNITTFKSSLSSGIHDIGIANVPSYDMHNNPYPVTIVDELYDTYESAKNAANEKNEEYKANLITKTPSTELDWEFQYELLKQNYDKTSAMCNLFEEIITSKTNEMPISSDKKDEYVKALRPLRSK